MSSAFGRRGILKLAITAAGITVIGPPLVSGLPQASPASAVRPLSLRGAAQDGYRRSLARLRRKVPRADGTEIAEHGTGSLASDPALLRASRNARPGNPDFDVLIVGSGYGGAVCAARLARHRRQGVKIGVLERGREWVPGTFPDR